MNTDTKRNELWFATLIGVGIILRYLVMTFGYNYDWESYCIVGEIAGNFRNVYAETCRYNYGMIFFCIQGFLYRVSQINPSYSWAIYRILMVGVLTATDLGITFFILKNHSLKKAIIFFLNPVSIIITGYHNQFDNIAIILALLALLFYNEEDKTNKNDFCFIALLTLSLITKHIMFMFPVFLIVRDRLPLKKKVLYSCIPPLIFLISFVPWAISSNDALQGIINNVFLYRSYNNAPLLSVFYDLLGIEGGIRFVVYVLMMCMTAFLTRKLNVETQMMIYFIAMVAFSSAIANQYLVIPMAALCVLDLDLINYLYMFMVGIYLVLQYDGLGMLISLQGVQLGIIRELAIYLVVYGYILAAWILFAALLYEAIKLKAEKKLELLGIK